MHPLSHRSCHTTLMPTGWSPVANPVPCPPFKQHHILPVHVCYHLAVPGDDLGPTVLQRNPIKDVARAPLQMKAANSLSYRLAAYTRGAKHAFPPPGNAPSPPSRAISTCCTSEETRGFGVSGFPTEDFSPLFRKNRGGRRYQTLKTFWWCLEGRQADMKRNLQRLSGIYNVHGPLWLKLLLFPLLDLRAYLSRSEYQRNSERQWGKE